jgi:hypothetical protein
VCHPEGRNSQSLGDKFWSLDDIMSHNKCHPVVMLTDALVRYTPKLRPQCTNISVGVYACERASARARKLLLYVVCCCVYEFT